MVDDILHDIKSNVNDMPPCRIINKIRCGIDEQLQYDGRSLIDGHINSIEDNNSVRDEFIQQCGLDYLGTNNKESNQQPSIKKTTFLFQEEDWKYSNGKWLPPETDYEAKIKKIKKDTQAQSDSGANRIVTDNIQLLLDVIMIDPIPMSGCNKEDEQAIICTAMGKLPIMSTTGEVTLATAYYSAEVDGTIISPTTLVAQFTDKYYGWMQFSHYDKKQGTITLLGRDGVENQSFRVTCSNDLWYHNSDTLGPVNDKAKINRLSNAARYELWHQRTCHAGTSTLESLHHHVDGVPQLKGNAFYRCPSCMTGKLATKQPIGRKKKAQSKPKDDDAPDEFEDDLYLADAEPGQHFAMDFGFVRGSDYNYKTKEGKTVTSIDGKNAYLAIIDRSSRYTWIFTTDSKKPPIKEAQMILNKFKSTNPHRTVRVDQGGELNSQAFKNMIAEEKYSLELTGSDSSAQNGLIENPNRTYGQMMRCMLHSSELGPEFWSFALRHAVYVKNRIPHHTIKTTPFEKFTGKRPNLSNLKIFGSKVYAKKPGKRPYKLDPHTASGIFLGYTATDKVCNYIDLDSARIKSATHIIFDEAHFTTPANKAPLAAQSLQRLGYYAKEDWVKEVNKEENDEEANNQLQIQLLTTTAKVPQRATPGSVGYDLHFDGNIDISIEPGEMQRLSTGISIKTPNNTYARIAPRSGLTVKNSLTTMAGVIDPDYTGEVQVLMHNFGTEAQTIKPQQRIAQILLEKIETPSPTICGNTSNHTPQQ